MNPNSSEVLASESTTNEGGDLSMVSPLLEQIQSPLLSVLADGAYDAEPVYRVMAECQPGSPPAVIIPPRATAVLRPNTGAAPSLRARHIQSIQEKGHRSRQRAVSYGQRSLVETDVPLQDPDWSHAPRSHAPGAENRSALGLLGMPISQRV